MALLMSVASIVVLVLLVVLAGCYDVRLRRIPNWLNASGLALGIALGAFQGLSGLKSALLGCLCALAFYLPLYLLRGMGGGDVKLMAAVGALAGPVNWLTIFFVTALLGGVTSLALIFYRNSGRKTLLRIRLILNELIHFRAPARREPELDIRHARALRLPHGAVIAVGSLVYLAHSFMR
jgi:prepilin peptidase CpaA